MPKVIHIRVDSFSGASRTFSIYPEHGWYDAGKSIRTTIQKQLSVPVAAQCLVLKDQGLIISDDDDYESENTFYNIIEGLDGAGEEATLELGLVRRSEELVQWLKDVRSHNCDGDQLQDAPESVRSSKEIFLAAAHRGNSDCFRYATEDLRADAEFVHSLMHASRNGNILLSATESIKASRDSVLCAVSHTGEVLEKVSAVFKSDEEIVLAAVKSSGLAFEFASKSLRSDMEFAMKAVQLNGHALGYVSEELQKDRNLALAAVKCTGQALGWAYLFLDDKEMVLAAVGNDGMALEIADESLQADKEVVTTAVINDGSAMQHASADLRNDKDFASQLVMQNQYALRHVGTTVTEDKALMTEIVCSGEQCAPDRKQGNPNFYPLEYTSAKLQADRDLVLKAVWHNGYNFAYASEHLKADREVAIHALRSPVGWRIWDNIPPSLHKDKLFAVEVVKLEDRVRDEFLEFFSEDELRQSA